MDEALTIDLWKLALIVAGFLFGVAGLVVAVMRWYLGTLAKGQRTLFAMANEHDDRLAQLEKFALLVDPSKSAMFLSVRPADFDKTVGLRPRK